jgi:hypothetical protein
MGNKNPSAFFLHVFNPINQSNVFGQKNVLRDHDTSLRGPANRQQKQQQQKDEKVVEEEEENQEMFLYYITKVFYAITSRYFLQ